MKFEVISVEAAGDLRFYLQFLPRKKRLILLLPHGFCLKAAGVLAENLSDEQRLIWGRRREKL
ncbi:hypothetical protein N9M29_01395 [Alphaproteobacteria bacterium]|nr:hypothetical protein [Alphaproteobacteria bacterium]MDA8666446.1 hypothetical protein [Alphaproteobacteria bacterium]MDA9581450.1 hypothetical protein [bacterium]MDB2431002.1 hypothetical protein [Alphaproteobacteria bacterium]MDB2626314.1 hypothetical protein [Alphaproteobacteria bacterium]